MLSSLIVTLVAAASEDSPHSLTPRIGLAVAVDTLQDVSASSEGGAMLELDYAYRVTSWFSPHAYAGALFSGGAEPTTCGLSQRPCDVTANVGYLGAKVRLTVPIPYFAPFLELGGGLTVGAFETRIAGRSTVDDTTATGHITTNLGLAIGPTHRFEIRLAAMTHIGQDQGAGGLDLGLRLDL